MKKSDRKKRTPKRILRLPDLDYAKRSVLNSLGSPASKRAYEFGIDDCCLVLLGAQACVQQNSRVALSDRTRVPPTGPVIDKPAFGGGAPACLWAADTGLLSPD